MIPVISKILRIPDRFVGPKVGIGRRVSDSGHAVMSLKPVGIKDFLEGETPYAVAKALEIDRHTVVKYAGT
jgi:hypothetical protein